MDFKTLRRRRRRRKRRQHGESIGHEEEMSLQGEITTREPNDSPHDGAGSNFKQQGSRSSSSSSSSSSSHIGASSSSSSSAIMPVVATTTNITTMDSLSDPLLMVVAEMPGPPPGKLHDKMAAFIKDLSSMSLVCQRWKKVLRYHDALWRSTCGWRWP